MLRFEDGSVKLDIRRRNYQLVRNERVSYP